MKTCGAWGGCVLPEGHNLGRVDIPERHRVPGRVVHEAYTVGTVVGGDIKLYRDCHGKIREYKTIESANHWASTVRNPVVLKVTVSRINYETQ